MEEQYVVLGSYIWGAVCLLGLCGLFVEMYNRFYPKAYKHVIKPLITKLEIIKNTK